MNLSPVEAISRINESVTVEMHVQRTKCCTGSRQVFLDSEANHRDPKNLGVVVTESGRTRRWQQRPAGMRSSKIWWKRWRGDVGGTIGSKA